MRHDIFKGQCVMKLYSWASMGLAHQVKASRAIVERTRQRVSKSLKSLEAFEETNAKLARILGQAARKV